ncbi:TIGR03943 family protein [Paenibacillus algorifonticola]|uniref:TIGR03943 family putative permease subunit n=1 Tax=Paenibacillus algorifonticola TaxID=684063 RepID=UPI003D2849A1
MRHHLLRAFILTAFALLIVYLSRSNQLSLYIAPRMELYVKLSALGLYAAAIHQLFLALKTRRQQHQHTAECGCEHAPSPSVFKNTVIYSLFIFPLALGFLSPAGVLGSTAASKKGVSFAASTTVQPLGTEPSQLAVSLPEPSASLAPKPLTLEERFPYDEYTKAHAEYGMKLYQKQKITVPDTTYIETLTTLDLYRDNFIGKTIDISGFIYKEDDMGEQRFAVSRFAMTCCSADAVPYGLMVQVSHADDYKDYAADDWVSVSGKLMTSMYNGNEILTLKLNTIKRIAAPESPYVYANFDF